MKIPSLIAGALLFCGGAAQAATVSYAASWAQGPNTSYTPTLLLPVFDPARAEIPDGAVLFDTTLRIQSSFTSFNHTYNNTSSSYNLQSVATIRVDFGVDEFSLSQPFSALIPAGGSNFQSFNLSNDFELSVTPPVVSSFGGDFHFVQGTAFYGGGGPHSQNPFTGFYSINEFMGGSVTATVTYIYQVPATAAAQVPDGGSTLLMVSMGLLALRRLAPLR